MPPLRRSATPDDDWNLPVASSPTPPPQSKEPTPHGLFAELPPSSPDWSDDETHRVVFGKRSRRSAGSKAKTMDRLHAPRSSIYTTTHPCSTSCNLVQSEGSRPSDTSTHVSTPNAPLRWKDKQRRMALMRSETLRRVAQERDARLEKRRHGRIRSAKYYSQHKETISARRKITRERYGALSNSDPKFH
ncbi:hypothetical protein PM082_019376 [Marasmius tenuissimus]|nr:hypothetical protein PM082_019266 [Marasmius tenuissimus]KAJ8075049.1 hypothetical protein PM082_019376 [Marasmius tenuissimus]